MDRRRPQDTITLRDAGGRPIPPGPDPTQIPFKFHVYWAGSDPDGDIAGFYYAVVETLPQDPLGGAPPSLPGPKPRDYKYTTKTDSTFIFTVSDQAPDREHAFFIYAVDNNGKADPTPARVIFNAQDKYPPALYMTLARATGPIFERLSDGTVQQTVRTYDISDTGKVGTLVSDFVPATARLDFAWRSEPVVAGNPAVQYNYKLDEVQFIPVDSSVTAVTYNTGVGADVVGPGLKLFTLRAIDQAGWRREIKRRFQFNLAPTTWFAGPDVNAYPYLTEAPGYRYVDATTSFTSGGPALPAITGSLLSPDSVFVFAAQRPERKTFFEIYKNKIYVRAEYDTVNMNSWVVAMNGGLDADSPYNVKVNPSDPDFQAIVTQYGQVPPVLQDAPGNGSPIGFRSNLTFNVFPTGRYVQFSPTGLYPIFDPTDPVRATNLNMYWPATLAGQAYLFCRAEDSFGRAVGGLDEQVGALEVPNLVARVGRDLTGGSDEDRAKRTKIITFYVDRAPYFQLTNAAFVPRYPGPQTFTSRNFDVNLLASDDDPYNINLPTDQRRTGGPTSSGILRYTITIRGVDGAGAPLTLALPASFLPRQTVNIPNTFAGTSVTLDVQLCDCSDCENQDGSGRCITQQFPIIVPPPTSAAGANSLGTNVDPDRGPSTAGAQ